MKITLVIPTFNGSEELKRLMEQVEAVLEQSDFADYEIVLVDDGSCGEYRLFIEDKLMPEHPCLRVLYLQGNYGQQLATITGLAHARGDIIATMDDDLEHPPAQLTTLIQSIREGSDLAYGIAEISYGSLLRKWGALLRDQVFRRVLRVPAGIRVSSFRAMTRELALAVIAGPCPWPYFSAMAVRRHPRIANIAMDFPRRTDGRQRILPLALLLLRILLAYSLPGAKKAPPVKLPPHAEIFCSPAAGELP